MQTFLTQRGAWLASTSGWGSSSGSPSPSSSSPSSSPSGSSPSPSGPVGAGCVATYAVTSQWDTGFQGDTAVAAGTSAISGWKVTWTFTNGQTISQFWNATVTSSGATVTATNLSYNGALAAGASTAFGFVGAWSGSNSTPTLTCTAS
jgi:cellulase/cellobiase CelA1